LPPPPTITGGLELLTVTTTLVEVLPLLLLQFREYVTEDCSGPVLYVPPVALLPLQPPEAVHDEALLDFHDKVLAFPGLTVLGDATKLTMGDGGLELTVTVVLVDDVPPVPLQLSE